MEVILRQDVDKLGKAGAIVKVKDGFARNFLIPNNLAVPLTPGNLKRLEQERQKRIRQMEKIKNDAQELKRKLEGSSLTLPVLTHEGEQLYGSITAGDIARALKVEGFDIDKKLILLDEPIKSLGIYSIPVKLHPEVLATIKVWVVKK
ncbi:MAG: 50S ribosomal protein L9 [Candidatus Omnitrophica bacterium]|nr:50S ribosomal protein L9 [Candidatus Omnitrophota bacterium]